MPNNDLWGYEQTIRTVESGESEWLRYEIDIPVEGKESSHEVFAVAASVSILAQALKGVKVKYIEPNLVKPTTLPQLLTFYTDVSKRGYAGATILAFYSRYIVQWYNKQLDESRFIEIAYAMKKANGVMYPEDLEIEGLGSSSVYVNNAGYLTIDAAHRVGLIGDGSTYKSTDMETGYTVHGHNPDSVTQQLVLIAGLARLYELVERDFLANL